MYVIIIIIIISIVGWRRRRRRHWRHCHRLRLPLYHENRTYTSTLTLCLTTYGGSACTTSNTSVRKQLAKEQSFPFRSFCKAKNKKYSTLYYCCVCPIYSNNNGSNEHTIWGSQSIRKVDINTIITFLGDDSLAFLLSNKSLTE